jgi:hypothetical protein
MAQYTFQRFDQGRVLLTRFSSETILLLCGECLVV